MSSPAQRLTPGLLTVLGLLAATSAIATDLYIPSIPSIAADLQTSPSQVQLTLSLFFFGVGAGQLILGPLSDSLGRRPVLIGGLTIFAAAGVAAAVAPSIELLIAFRLVQGLAGSVGMVLARAIAADLSTGETAVRALSLIAMVVGLGPLLAPPLGGLVHELWGWRGVLATLATISIAMLATGWLVVPESLPRERRLTHGVRNAVRPMGSLLRDRRFVALMLANALGFTAMIAYISASPFVGQHLLGMSPLVYAIAFSAGASAILIANFVNARLAPRVGPTRMLGVGSGLLILGGFGMLVLVATGTLTAVAFVVFAFVLTSGAGLTASNASALALARAGHARGSGAALLGAVQFAFGGCAAPLVGFWGEGTALPMAFLAAGAAVLSAMCVAVARR